MKNNFLDISTTLQGNSIIQVTYFELSYEEKKPYWDEYDDFDSVDYGIELRFEDGRIFSITWDNEHYAYGISMFDGEISQFLKSYNSWNVTEQSDWKKVVEHSLDSIEVIWNVVETETNEKISYPQTLIMKFSNSEIVYLSAYEYSKEQRKLFPMADNLIVIFSKGIASTYNLI